MKVAVCAIAKNENKYINEWAEHYISLGVDKIYLFDNNNSSTDFVGDYINEQIISKVEIINKNDVHIPRFQWHCYQEFYDTYSKNFNWCLFCDIDEFLVGTSNIKEFLGSSAFKDFDQIRVKWHLFGDDNQVTRDMNKSIIKSFTKVIDNNEELSNQGKFFIRGGLADINIQSCHRADYSSGKPLKSCLPSGTLCSGDGYKILEDYSKQKIFLNHYMTKTISEFIDQKLTRGDAVWESRELNFDYFWQINKQTPEKLAYIAKAMTAFDDKIDLVVPYVDSSDPVWQKVFNKYKDTVKKSNQTTSDNRFRTDDVMFRYFFRSIAQYMPWINNIFVLVACKTQIPDWLDQSKVIVITHEQFIPKQFLPTFNSGTIEMFLQNIPGLSEQFIYANDDFYLSHLTKKTDFFINGKCCFNIMTSKQNPKEINNDDWIWWQMCQNNHDVIYNTKNAIPFKRLGHEFRPYLKSQMWKCYNKNIDKIFNSISMFRASKNLTCYLYSLDLQKNGYQQNSNLKRGSITATTKSSELVNIFKNNAMIVINDNDANTDINKSNNLQWLLYTEYTNKSKYELFDLKNKPTNPNTQKNITAYGQPNTYLYF